MSASEHQAMVLDNEVIEVQQELVRQHEKWGEQRHPDGTGPTRQHLGLTMNFGRAATLAKTFCDEQARYGDVTWRDILLEEVFEAMAEDDEEKLLLELNQVAAVAAQWRKAVRRRQQVRRSDAEAEGYRYIGRADQIQWANGEGRMLVRNGDVYLHNPGVLLEIPPPDPSESMQDEWSLPPGLTVNDESGPGYQEAGDY